MAEKFGLKIGLEGEKEFKAALADINQSFKVLGSEMKLVESQFDKNDDSVEALTARNEVLAKQIDAQKSKIEVLRDALKNASESFGENDKRTQAWQIQLNNAEAALNKMERELRENEDALDNAGDGMDDAGKEADKMGDEIEDSGKQADDAGGKFEGLGTICKATAATIAAAFAAVAAASVAAGKALVDMATEGAAYADDVLTTATQTGIATDKLQEYMYAAELVDVSTETLTKSMAKNIKSMSTVVDVSCEAAVDMDKLAKAESKAADAAINLEKAQIAYDEAVKASGAAVGKAYAAVEDAMLGVESAQVAYNAAVEKGGADSEAAQKAALALEKAQNKLTTAQDAYNTALAESESGTAAVQKAALAVEQAQLKLADAQAAVTSASQPVEPAMNEMTEAYNKLGVAVYDAEGNMRDSDTVYWEIIDALGKMENETERDAIAMQILGKSAQELNPLIEAGAERMADLGKEAQEAGYVLGDDALNAYGALDDQLQYLSVGAEAAKNALGQVLLPVLTELASDGVGLLGEFTNGINAAGGDLSKMADVVADIMPKIIDVVMEHVPMLLELIVTIVTSLGKAIVDNLPIIVDSVSELLFVIMDALVSAQIGRAHV